MHKFDQWQNNLFKIKKKIFIKKGSTFKSDNEPTWVSVFWGLCLQSYLLLVTRLTELLVTCYSWWGPLFYNNLYVLISYYMCPFPCCILFFSCALPIKKRYKTVNRGVSIKVHLKYIFYFVIYEQLNSLDWLGLSLLSTG